MIDIYRQASKVLVWLTSEVTPFIREIVHVFDEWPASRRVLPSRDTTEVNCHPFMTHSQLLGLSEFLKLPWFRRIWVVQEVAVAHTVL